MTHLTAAVVLAVATEVCVTALLVAWMLHPRRDEVDDGDADTVLGRASAWNTATEELSVLEGVGMP